MNNVIFGAGKFGRYIYDVFLYNQNITAFVDNYNRESTVGEIPIWDMKELKKQLPHIDRLYLAIRSYYAMGDVLLQLHDIGLREVWIVKPELWEKREDNIETDLEQYVYHMDISYKAVLSKLEFHVCDTCNLNCKGCSHFSPIFEGGFVEVEDFQCQMTLLKKAFANIFRFRLMGGEPFLHKELSEFVKISRETFPNTHLEIVTNGLLLQRVGDETWKSIHENDAVLNISLYPPTFRIKDKIADFLENRGIKYSFGSGLEQYNDDGIIEEFHKGFTENYVHDPVIASQNCMGHSCHYMRQGKISKCALPLLAPYINEYYNKLFITSADDFIDLNGEIEPWEMARLLHQSIPFCAYCIEEKPQRFSWDINKNNSLDDYVVKEKGR